MLIQFTFTVFSGKSVFAMAFKRVLLVARHTRASILARQGRTRRLQKKIRRFTIDSKFVNSSVDSVFCSFAIIISMKRTSSKHLFKELKILYLNGKVMWTLVSFVLWGVSVFIRRQQLAPNFFVSPFRGGHVHRKAGRIVEAFKGAIKRIVYRECSNSRHVQIMELFFYKYMLSDSFWNRIGILDM